MSEWRSYKVDIKKYIEKINKKVSKRKEDIRDFKESHNPELINAIPVYERENAEYETIISMLEKQMPKEVEYYGQNNKISYYACSHCGRVFWEKEHIGNYCDNCGQRLEVSQ